MAYITERSKDDHTFLPKSNYFKVKGWFDHPDEIFYFLITQLLIAISQTVIK